MLAYRLLIPVAVAAGALPAVAEPSAEPEPEPDIELAAARHRHRVSVSGGLSSLVFEDAELLVPVQLRFASAGRWAIELGFDSVCTSDPLCAVLGFYRAGALVYLGDGSLGPYLYGRASYLLHPAHSLDGDPVPYNVELHYGAGAGLEWDLGRLGIYGEGGAFGDVGGDFVIARLTAGVLVRFGPRAQ